VKRVKWSELRGIPRAALAGIRYSEINDRVTVTPDGRVYVDGVEVDRRG